MSDDEQVIGDSTLSPFIISGGEHPHDPYLGGFVGKGRRNSLGATPDPNGNRAERRAAKRAGRSRMYTRREE